MYSLIKKIIKILLGSWLYSLKLKVNTVKLIMKNRTLKLGFNVLIDRNSSIGKYNYLATGVTFKNSIIGDYSYIGENSYIHNTTIGKFTCIGPNVKIGLGEHPTNKFVSVHPIFYSTAKQVGVSFVKKEKFDEYQTKPIIGNDVWIGTNVIISSNITVGDGAIIAAGSVVTKDVLPYSIVGGVPAKNIKKRFSPEEIETLRQVKWWEWTVEDIRQKVEFFDDIKLFLKSIDND